VNPGVGEERCPKVEDKVDASKLLPGLDEDTGERPKSYTIIRGSEAVHVGTCTNFLLVLQIAANLLELESDLTIINRERGKAGKCPSGFGITILLDQPTR
jgi:hypothetical protein